MGSKPVRAAHMMKYGATVSEVEHAPTAQHDYRDQQSQRKAHRGLKGRTGSTTGTSSTSNALRDDDDSDAKDDEDPATPGNPFKGSSAQTGGGSRPPSRTKPEQEAVMSALMYRKSNRSTTPGAGSSRGGLSPSPGASGGVDASMMSTATSMNGHRSNRVGGRHGPSVPPDPNSVTMATLFPPYGEPPEVADVDPDIPYPKDWRKNPTGHCSREGVQWLYDSIVMDRLIDPKEVVSKATAKIDRLLKEQGILPVSDMMTTRQEVRDMIRNPKRFGILFDILATRRNVMTGKPHDTAQRLYDYVEEKYPVFVVHMFVGLTDNGTKRVARDIFNSNPPAPKHTSEKKVRLPFEDIDSQHLYVVHPNGQEAEEMKRRGEEFQLRKEAEDERRHCTPKYKPPAPPKWLQRIEEQKQKKNQERQEQQREQQRSGSRQSNSRTATPASFGATGGRSVTPGDRGLRLAGASPSQFSTHSSAATLGGASSTVGGWESAGPSAKERSYPIGECDRCWLFCRGKPRPASRTSGADGGGVRAEIVTQEDNTMPDTNGGANDASATKEEQPMSASPFTFGRGGTPTTAALLTTTGNGDTAAAFLPGGRQSTSSGGGRRVRTVSDPFGAPGGSDADSIPQNGDGNPLESRMSTQTKEIDFAALHMRSRQAKRRATKFRVNTSETNASGMGFGLSSSGIESDFEGAMGGEPPSRLEELRKLAVTVGLRTVTGEANAAKPLPKIERTAYAPAQNKPRPRVPM